MRLNRGGFRQLSLVAIAIAFLGMSVSFPAGAGSLADKATAELNAFGEHAGYIVATIHPCGGNGAEVGFFVGQVKKMLEAIGADDADIGVALVALAVAQSEAKPVGRDCTDEGGLTLATKLGKLRDAVRDAGK
jgi:hypothetical protein